MEGYNVSNITKSAFLLSLVEIFYPLRWLFLAGIVLTICDLRFGIRAARYRQEEVRLSRALRRTCNKIVDYALAIILAGVLGKAFGTPLSIPLFEVFVMLLVYIIELNSCFCNFYASRGEVWRFDLKEMLFKRIAKTIGKDE